MSMNIMTTRDANKITFTLAGRLDTATAPEFQDALISAFDEARLVELDFAELTYVSSAGLRVLLLGEKTAKAKDSVMSLLNVSADIKEVFEMTGFSDILKIM